MRLFLTYIVLAFLAVILIYPETTVFSEYDRLSDWIVENSEMKKPDRPPKIEFFPQKELILLSGQIEIIALYIIKKELIMLNVNFNINRLTHKSILLHEIVHHFQKYNKTEFACSAEREKQPYGLQKKWAEEQGFDVVKEMELDSFTILMITSCMNL